MKPSVFTPVHSRSEQFVADAYQSLLRQTFQDWQWIIGLNGGASDVAKEIRDDRRVRVVRLEDDSNASGHNCIGRLKRELCALASGDVLVELDADDILTEKAIESVLEAFSRDAVQMAYSNSAQFEDKTWKPSSYSRHWGWVSRPFVWHERGLIELVAWPPSPHMMRQIYWAPNHVRAWRRSGYDDVGGHTAMEVADDHDLCCRLYCRHGSAGFKHLDECLYLYRMHPENTAKTNNGLIQKMAARNYLKYVGAMAERWALDCGLSLLDLGGRINPQHGYATVDVSDADIECDLTKPWPIADDSVGVLRAHHVLEHLPDPIHAMNEAYRVLAPGGWMFVEVPCALGQGAFRDPTHKSFWVQQSFLYYTNKEYAKYIQPQYRGRFQVSRSERYMMQPDVPVIAAELICLKPPYSLRPVGEVLI